MWVSTSKGKTVKEPSAAEIVGALVSAGPDEAVVVGRDLMRFAHAARLDAGRFAVAVRDGSPSRQVTLACGSVHDVAATLVAFATDADFARALVDRLLPTAKAA